MSVLACQLALTAKAVWNTGLCTHSFGCVQPIGVGFSYSEVGIPAQALPWFAASAARDPLRVLWVHQDKRDAVSDELGVASDIMDFLFDLLKGERAPASHLSWSLLTQLLGQGAEIRSLATPSSPDCKAKPIQDSRESGCMVQPTQSWQAWTSTSLGNRMSCCCLLVQSHAAWLLLGLSLERAGMRGTTPQSLPMHCGS